MRIGSQFYLQKLGIPQGSVLSPLLCSIFFGHVDRHFFDPLLQQPATAEEILEVEPQQVLPSLQSGKKRIAMPSPLQSTPVMSKATSLASGGNGSILLRLIDDSLFISTSQADVARFVQIMHQGFEDYGCHANRHKTTVSFNLQLSKDQENFSRNIYMSEDGASFMAWSGLLINCCTLEIQADYTRCPSLSLHNQYIQKQSIVLELQDNSIKDEAYAILFSLCLLLILNRSVYPFEFRVDFLLCLSMQVCWGAYKGITYSCKENQPRISNPNKIMPLPTC